MRCVEELSLSLRGLTVLIGDNGSGKSVLVEACEILRRASTESFFGDLLGIHGGLFSLLRRGAPDLCLAVWAEGAGPPLRYLLTFAQDGHYTVIHRESLVMFVSDQHAVPIIDRTRERASVVGPSGMHPVEVSPEQLVLTAASGPFSPHPALPRMRRTLASIEVHVPFEVTPSWVAKADGRRSESRGEMQLQRVDRLERLGKNLPNVFAALQNEFGMAHWTETMEYVRLGLGQEVETISLRAGAAAGTHSLWLKMRGRDVLIPASSLADGVLAYLAFVALFRLPRPERALLAFDEPDLHLHPELLARVLGFFEEMAEHHPVVLATHSDRLLDSLQRPVEAVRVCEIEQPAARTRLRTLDADTLTRWLADYRGLGDVRSAGYLPHVLAKAAEEPPAKAEQGGEGSS
jgi:predicted ATPase